LSLTASVLNSNFWASQRPLRFVMPNGMSLPVLELQITGASLTATLGPKELPNGPPSSTP
jgi:hypothetical protein